MTDAQFVQRVRSLLLGYAMDELDERHPGEVLEQLAGIVGEYDAERADFYEGDGRLIVRVNPLDDA